MGFEQDAGQGRTPRRASRARWRRVAVGMLVVVGTLGFWVAGVSGQDFPIRVGAITCAVVAASLAVVLARRRDGLVGWFVLGAIIAVYRMVTD